MNASKQIPKSKNWQAAVKMRIKFLFGAHAAVGKTYLSCFNGEGKRLCNECRLRLYDPDTGTVMLETIDSFHCAIFLHGDCAAFRGTLYTEKKSCSIFFYQPLKEVVEGCLTKHPEAHTVEDFTSALCERYPKLPSGYLKYIASAYAADHL